MRDWHIMISNFKNHYRVLWVGILIASYFGIVFTCLYQWDRFEARPTVISLERDFRNWNLTLPAITVCYGNKVNESKAKEFIEKLVPKYQTNIDLLIEYTNSKWNISESHNDYEYFLDFIKTVVNTDIATLQDYLKFDHDDRLENVDLFEMTMTVFFIFFLSFYFNFYFRLLQVRRTRNHRTISFDVDFLVDEREIMTEQGLCYSMNGPITALLQSKYNHEVCFIIDNFLPFKSRENST